MDFKMADTSERRVFCNTILFKYHDLKKNIWVEKSVLENQFITAYRDVLPYCERTRILTACVQVQFLAMRIRQKNLGRH